MTIQLSRPGTHGVSGKPSLVSKLGNVDASAPVTIATPATGPLVELGTAAGLSEIMALTQDTLGGSAPTFVLGGMWDQADALTMGAGSGSGQRTDDNSDMALRGDFARSEYGVTGAGIKIGILSDSFNVLGGMTTDIADGDLPAGIQILEEGAAGSHDEGRAMADLIHRIAPGAEIAFHTATGSEADFAAGIAALQAAGCNIIVDDVAYMDEPFFQDGGAVEAAVEKAVASGVSYFTAASNEGTDYIQQSFQGMRAYLPGVSFSSIVQNFGTKSAPQGFETITVPAGGVLKLDMQWDQPFATIGTGHSSANSLGIALYNSAGSLVAAAGSNMVGGNPDQILSYTNNTSGTSFKLVVFVNGGSTLPGQFKIINYGNGTIGSGVGSGSGTVIGHEMVEGDNTVAAVNWDSTARFGGSNTVESFSSVGTGDFLFNAQGNRLASAQSTQKVNFASVDGSVTSVFAPFFGTSAAAPGAAAVAALMLQEDPSLTPTQVTRILELSASSTTGAAHSGGYGLIQADSAVQMAKHLLSWGTHS